MPTSISASSAQPPQQPQNKFASARAASPPIYPVPKQAQSLRAKQGQQYGTGGNRAPVTSTAQQQEQEDIVEVLEDAVTGEKTPRSNAGWPTSMSKKLRKVRSTVVCS